MNKIIFSKHLYYWLGVQRSNHWFPLLVRPQLSWFGPRYLLSCVAQSYFFLSVLQFSREAWPESNQVRIASTANPRSDSPVSLLQVSDDGFSTENRTAASDRLDSKIEQRLRLIFESTRKLLATITNISILQALLSESEVVDLIHSLTRKQTHMLHVTIRIPEFGFQEMKKPIWNSSILPLGPLATRISVLRARTFRCRLNATNVRSKGILKKTAHF